MIIKIEEVNQSQPILFIFSKKTLAVKKIEKKLTQYHYQIFSSPFIPKNFNHFSYIFIFNEINQFKKILKTKINKSTKIFLILINQKKELGKLEKIYQKEKTKNFKVINIDETSFSEKNLETVFWFLFSQSKEKFLNLEIITKKKLKKPTENFSLEIVFDRLKKRFFYLVFFFVFLGGIFFIFPLAATGIILYQSFRAFEQENFSRIKNSLFLLPFLISLTKKTYQLPRPVFSLFYLSLLPDNLISLEENGYLLLETSLKIKENGQKIIPLILKQEKKEEEKKDLLLRLSKLKEQVGEASKRISLISQKIDYRIEKIQKLKEKLLTAEDSINQLKKILDFADEILGGQKEKKYLILFQNNMELRPGGGFIGSFGIATFSDYTLKKLEIEDVYEADGQLKAHIEPPFPIKKYLNQPHWFLRDSNFSPDFKENFNQAEFFLEKELGLAGFDGGMAITTTAINYILEAFGEIYLPDYEEKINKDNFYIKTQLYVEKDFFPGSIQKRSFLSSLVRVLLLNLEDVSLKKLTLALKKALSEKQMVFYFKNEQLDKTIVSFGWGGRLIVPRCLNQTIPCLIDNFYPIDANLGVNKVNFFINRLINFKVKIKENQEVENFLSLAFKNESIMEAFPGGTYKNYFQVYLPGNCRVKNITKDGFLIDKNQYQETNEEGFKIIGFYFELPPKKTTEIKINYLLKDKIKKGRQIYQLITQKQIGSTNNDFVLEFYFPKNVYPINHNFSPIAKDNHLVYNTTLSTDKIFFIELVWE